MKNGKTGDTRKARETGKTRETLGFEVFL